MRAAIVAGTAIAAVAAASLLAAFTPPTASNYLLPDPGLVVNAGLPALRIVALVAAAMSIGNLLLAAVLAPGDPVGLVSPIGYGGLRAARGWATVQAFASAGVAVLLTAENTGIRPSVLLVRPGTLVAELEHVQQAGGWFWGTVGAVVVAIGAAAALSWRTAVGLLVTAVASLLPLALTIATVAERSHDIVGYAVTLHVVAALLWLGSTAAVAVHLARRGPDGATIVRRHRVLARWCLVVVTTSGVVVAAYAMSLSDLVTSAYGLLVGLATVATVLAARRVVRPERTGGAAALRLAVVELAALGVAAAAGTALTRILPPLDIGYVASRLVYLIGFDLPPHLTATDLLTTWRPDLVFGPIAVLAAFSYLSGVRRLRSAGGDWPARRTAAWLAGCAVLLVATCSGIATYGRAVFSLHMAAHMLLATVVPVLLVLGHGLTLATETAPVGVATRLHSLVDAPVTRFVRHPAVAWLGVAATLFVLYLTGLFGAIVQQHWAHLAMDTAFLGTGLALFWPVLGSGSPSRELPAIGRVVMVFAVMALHAGFAVWLLAQPGIVADEFYAALRLPFVSDLLADQSSGAVLGWALGEVPTLLAVVALVSRWGRADRQQEARAVSARPSVGSLR